jgi:hypothetical protein
MMNAVIVHRLTDETAAANLAARTGARLVPDATAAGQQFIPRPAVPARALLSLAAAEFVLAVNSPRNRLVWPALAVPARLPRGDRLLSDNEEDPLVSVDREENRSHDAAARAAPSAR